MKIAFVNVPSLPDTVLTVYPPYGILSMASCLKEAGHEVAFIDSDVLFLDTNATVSMLKSLAPDLIGLTVNVSQVSHAIQYIKDIQSALERVPIIVGGPFVTGTDMEVFDYFPTIEYAVAGEGEHAIVAFAEHLENKTSIDTVPNLLYKTGAGVTRTRRERIEDIDALPMPDYELVRDIMAKYSAPYPSIAAPSISIMCTRGCPFNCSFCSSPSNWGRKATFRTPESIIKELQHIRKTIDVREVFFQDDTFNMNRKWFFELCDMIIETGMHKEIFFKASMRANKHLITEELLAKAREANIWMIFYGVESGSQDMLDRMNKNITIDEIKRAFRMTNEAGIMTYASMMIGNDGETRKTARASMKLYSKIMPNFGGFAIAAPFPGSQLYAIAKEKNHITGDFSDYRFGSCILKTDALEIDDIISLHAKASAIARKTQRAFLGSKQAKRLLSNFAKQIESDPHMLILGVLQDKLKVRRFQATLTVLDTDLSFSPSETKSINVKLENKSPEAFGSAPPHPVNISYHWINADTRKVEVFDGTRTSLASPLAPQETIELPIRVSAPDKPGNYILQLTMVQEAVSWLEKYAKDLPVEIPISLK